MKTLKFTAAASLILFFVGLTSVFSNQARNINTVKPNGVIRYQVDVQFNVEIDLCNTYQVVLVDENGKMVSSPETFRPGIATYVFSENGPVSGVRAAVLILNQETMHFICPNELFTAPDVKRGDFMPGKTYIFNLVPMLKETPASGTSEAPKQ